MKMTVSRLLRCSAFVLILLLMVAASALVFRPKDNREEDGIQEPVVYAFLGEPENTMDVLVLGDSLAECAVSPAYLWQEQGITAFTAATGNQKLFQSVELLETFCEKQNPKMVLLEANTVYSTCPKTDILSNKLQNLLPVLRYHDRWKNLQLRDFFGQVHYTYTTPEKGFHLSVEVNPPEKTNYMKKTDSIKTIRSENVAYVRQIREYCTQMGAKLVLFSAPSASNWNYKQHNGIVQLAEELGLEYIDMNLMLEELGIDWNADTMDWGNHMNCAGARKVTAWVGEYLAGTGLFTDKRENAAYSAWNDAVRQQEKDIAALEE